MCTRPGGGVHTRSTEHGSPASRVLARSRLSSAERRRSIRNRISSIDNLFSSRDTPTCVGRGISQFGSGSSTELSSQVHPMTDHALTLSRTPRGSLCESRSCFHSFMPDPTRRDRFARSPDRPQTMTANHHWHRHRLQAQHRERHACPCAMSPYIHAYILHDRTCDASDPHLW